MSVIASLLFCNDCGNLLERATSTQKATVTCDVCGAKCKGKSPQHHFFQAAFLHIDGCADTSSNKVTTKSRASAFPSALRAKRSAVQTLKEGDVQTEATIRMTCSECGREEMRYYTLQLRSADEGSTVFYHCDCGNK